MAVGELVRYADFPRGKFHVDADPLDLVISHQLRVFIKFDTEQYVARTKSFVVSIRDKMLHLQNGYVALGLKRRVNKFPDGLDAMWDSEICLLALDYASIAQIRATGDCTVKVFEHGGLKLVSHHPSGRVDRVGAPQRPLIQHEEVPFAECYLVDKWRMLGYGVPHEVVSSQEPLDKHAAPVPIQRKDLYFEKAALERLGRESDAYPPDDGKVRPVAIIWLYKVSVAVNSGLIRPLVVDEVVSKVAGYKEIEKWLDVNAPEGAAKGALKRTARTIAPQSYNRSNGFDEEGLVEIPGSDRVPTEHLSLPVRYALAFTERWIDQKSKNARSTHGLACELLDAGFGRVAALDLLGMISGEPVPRNEQEKFWALVEKILRRRAMGKVGARGTRKILRKSSASSQPENAGPDGVED